MTHRPLAAALALIFVSAAGSASAQDAPPPLPPVTYDSGPAHLPQQPARFELAYSADERAAWLAECRARYADNGLGGAVIGGLAGGILGHEIAGSGNRTVGTIIGAGAGAVVGAAIDRAEDQGRLDACEDYLARYENSYLAEAGAPGSYGAAYGDGYGAPVMWVPVKISHRHGKGCGCGREEVVEEWIEEEVIETPVRVAPPAPVKTVPVKTVPAAPRSIK